MFHRIGRYCLVLTALALAATAVAEWPIPTPEKTEHPGAKAAPASSPTTYGDADGFARRRETLIDGLITADLGGWRRGYFAGGDPGKYLPGHAMARLVRDPKDAEALKYMNDDRSYKEHYHFAAVNWARFYPIFADALTDETKEKLFAAAKKYGSYHSGGGTENHVVMWRTSANVLPYYFGDGMLGHRGKDAMLRTGKEWLANYVKGLYAGGQGEWDSSTYLAFDINGMLNIYDFSKDEESRLLAKAALDWYAAAYALKYRDGVYTAPNQRGYAPGAIQKITDHIGWLWWGSDRKVEPDDVRNDGKYSMHAATSGYRPNAVLTNIARKKLPGIPFEARNAKPNYWGTTGKPSPGAYPETLYVDTGYSMGSLWRGHGSQMTRFQIVVDTDAGGVVFSGGNPRQSDHTGKKTGIGFHDGTGRYTQQAQSKDLFISMSQAPAADDQAQYSYFLYPKEAKASQVGKWQVFEIGGSAIAVYPLGGSAELTETPKDKRGNSEPMLKIAGQRSGFVVFAVGRDAAALKNVKVDDAKFAQDMDVTVSAPGNTLRMKFNADPSGDSHGNRVAEAWIDGSKVDVGTWPVYSSPYVKQSGGVMTVNDGSSGYVVDFTGDLPVYKAWTK